MERLSLEFFDRFKTSTYIPVSSAALLMYDAILTFPDELRYVWSSSWSVGKSLYLLSRYPILFNVIAQLHRNAGHDVSYSECHILYALTGYMYLFGVLAAEAILVVRVWALWQRRKIIAWILAIMTIIGLTVGLVAVFELQSGQFFVPKDAVQSLSYPGCISVAGSNNTTIVSYVVLMVYEGGIFSLMIINGVVTHLRLHSTATLMYGFYKDGVIYFLSLIAVSVVNLAVILTQPPEYTNLLVSTQAALHSTLSSRMLLNIRYRSEQSRKNLSLNSYASSVDASRQRSAVVNASTRTIIIGHRTAETQAEGMAWFGHGSQVMSRRGQSEVAIELGEIRH